jgi:CrcB protein
MPLLAIFLGGALGAVARYGLSGAVYRRFGPSFPSGTLAVNLVGSAALGLLMPLVGGTTPLTTVRAFLIIGCIGAFTTFSTFAWEAVALIEDGQWRSAAAYVALSVFLGLGFVAAGLSVARLLL